MLLCCVTCKWIFLSWFKGIMQKEVIPEHDPEGSFWTYKGGRKQKIEANIIKCSVIFHTHRQILLGIWKYRGCCRRIMCHAGDKNEITVVICGKLEGKGPVGKSRNWCEDRINISVIEIRWEIFSCICFGHVRGRLCKRFCFLLNEGNYTTDREAVSSLARILFDVLVSGANYLSVLRCHPLIWL